MQLALCKLLLLLSMAGSIFPFVPAAEGRTLSLPGGQAIVREAEAYDQDRRLTETVRSYSLDNGDLVRMARVTAERDVRAVALLELELRDGGDVHWYDASAGYWRQAPLSNQYLSDSLVVVTPEDGGQLLFYTPRVYEDLGSGTLRLVSGGGLSIRAAEDGGFTIQLRSPAMEEGRFADYTAVVSGGRLLDLEDPDVRAVWEKCALDGPGRWCFDGYYYSSPTNYVPTGADCYYRLPAAYVLKEFVRDGGQVRAAYDLAVACLDTMALQQNDHGYFPTLPESQWLSGDYGIGAGFYDTRFNSDLALLYHKAAAFAGCPEFDAVMERYFDYFLNYAQAHHRETASGGWLVEDYGHPDGGSPTHVSLNHQLAEILALYQWGDRMERPELTALADRMLLAVTDTARSWIAPDGDLHYGYYDGEGYGHDDYPYLTYNDLLFLERYLTERGDPAPRELLLLKETKLRWMRENRVTGYAEG